jgi:hypothetical protein
VVAVWILNIWRWRFRLLLQVFSSVANANTRFAYTAATKLWQMSTRIIVRPQLFKSAA